MGHSTISYLWRDKLAPQGYHSGVSLHSHTNQSHETLDFLANFGNQYPVMRPLLERLERRSERMHGVRIDYAASYWTPPMTPKLAFDLESRQIEKLNLDPMVSLTDHDNITAPMLLRTTASARPIPADTAPLTAFRCCGRLLVTIRTPLSRRTRTSSGAADRPAADDMRDQAPGKRRKSICLTNIARWLDNRNYAQRSAEWPRSALPSCRIWIWLVPSGIVASRASRK